MMEKVYISPYTNKPITKSASPKNRTFLCKACQITLNSPVSVLQHFRGRLHKSNVETESFKQMDDSYRPKDKLKSTSNENKNSKLPHNNSRVLKIPKSTVDKKRKGQLLSSQPAIKKGKIQALISTTVDKEDIPSLMSQSINNDRFSQPFISSPGFDERISYQRNAQSLTETNSQPRMLQALHDARNHQPLLSEPFERIDQQNVPEPTINGRVTPLMSKTTVYESFSSGASMPQSLVNGRIGNPSSVSMGRMSHTELVADEGFTHFSITRGSLSSAFDKTVSPSPNPPPCIGAMDLNYVPSNETNIAKSQNQIAAHCNDCNISFKSEFCAREHFQGKRHQKTIASKQVAEEQDIMTRWQNSGTGTGLRVGAGGHYGRLWRNKYA